MRRSLSGVRRRAFTCWVFADLPRPLLLKLAMAGALSLAVVSLGPRTVERGDAVPPAGMLLATAALVGLICGGSLLWGLRSDLGLPLKIAVYAVIFNVAVIAVKLWLAPHGFYEVNQQRDLDGVFSIDNEPMAFLAGATVFALYFAAYYFLYRVIGSRIIPSASRPPRYVSGRAVVLIVVLATLLLVTAGAALFLVLIPLAAGFEYLSFVFTSGLSLAIAALLACATAFAAMTLSSTADRARVVGDVSVFMSVFWVGLYFLALYHALWVVYVLLLTSIWPLKTVTPK